MAQAPVASADVLINNKFAPAWYIFLQQIATPPYQKSAGISGTASLNVPNTSVYYLNPTGSVTALTLAFPTVGDAAELTLSNISASNSISGVTYPSMVVNGPSSFGPGAFARFKFSLQDVKWYRIG